jgi:3-methyladenine DNA glycosylase AlkD
MTCTEVMRQLESLGTEQARKIYRRHGAGDNTFGVSFANLGALKKKFKTDHELARQLWATGNFDARALATMIADPKQATAAELDAWVKDANFYGIVDVFAAYAASTPLAPKLREKWIKSKEEYVAQAGWWLLSHALKNGESFDDADLEARIAHIEKHIHAAQNRVRHSMNGVLISIGVYVPHLEQQVLAAAARIGKVVVDHGETGCKTPDAAAYIAKAKARPPKKGKA